MNDLRNHEHSGYLSHESPAAFSFNAKQVKKQGIEACKIVAAPLQRDAMSDQRSKSSQNLGTQSKVNGVDSQNAPKFARISNRNKSDSKESIKIMRQQEVLLGINQKVR